MNKKICYDLFVHKASGKKNWWYTEYVDQITSKDYSVMITNNNMTYAQPRDYLNNLSDYGYEHVLTFTIDE